MNRPLLSSGLAIAAVIALSGCAGVPATHYYVLEPQESGAAASGPRSGVAVGVEAFQVDAPYDQDRIVYRVGEGSAEIGFYAYHRWAAPLSRMLPRVVAAALEGAARLRSIEPAAPGRDYAARLRGRLRLFEEIDTAEGPRVRVQLSLTLHGKDGAKLWSETVAGESAVGSDEVVNVVERMKGTLDETLRKVRPGLERALKQHRGS